MKQKGFTLVELLAVIVILAVIALIATPQVLSMIESSRKGAAESSVLSYVDAVEKTIVVKLMNASSDTNYNQTYEIKGLSLTNVVDGTVQLPCLQKGTTTQENYGALSDGKCDTSTQENNKKYVSFKIEIKGDQPASDAENRITVTKNVVTEAYIKFSKYYVSYFYDNDTGKTTYCSTADSDTFLTKDQCNTKTA